MNATWIEEKRRPYDDIALRHRLTTTDEADELILRVEDAIAAISLDLDHEAGRSDGDPPDAKRVDWRERAKRALSRMEFALRQVQKRRDLLARQEQRK